MPTNNLINTNKLNQEFYESVGLDFDSSRQYFWPGWQKLIENGELRVKNLNVLDLACGNCRFYEFLRGEFKDFNYTGVDFSRVLLNQANAKFKDEPNFTTHYEDLLKNKWDSSLKSEKYDLIVLFGLMHHLPNEISRVNLFKKIKSLLRDDGILVFATWQFLDVERLQKKLISLTAPEIKPFLEKYSLKVSEFGSNDFIMDWKKGTSGYRFCHYYSQNEIEALLKDTDFKLLDTYLADGKENTVNKYYICK